MKKLIILLLGTLSLMSCKKFLQEYSQTDVIPKSASDFGELLYTEGYPRTYKVLQPWSVFMTDDVQCYYGPVLEGTNAAAMAAPFYQWQPNFDITATTTGIGSVDTWETYYKLLLGTNVALQYLDNSTGTQLEINQYKGEAYTLRAFYHFILVNFYARPYNDSTTTPDKSPGVPLRTTANMADGYLGRNTVKEVYDQIEKDLDSAMYLLDAQKATTEPYRISYLAAHLIASRVYLYEEKWDKAIEHANFVIQYHPQLMDYNEWIGVPDLTVKPLMGTSNIESLWCYGLMAEQIPDPYNTAYNVSHDLVNTFEPNDLRFQLTISETPEFLKEYIAFDYYQFKAQPSDLDVSRFLTTSWRSSEAYLNLAEAAIQKYRTKGDAEAGNKAVAALNTLREHRFTPSTFVPWTIQPADKLLEMCRTERRRELYAEECHRWFDLRRYGMPAITHVYQPRAGVSEVYRLKKGDPQYTISIPQNAISRNPALIQNPISEERKPE
jgi:hypothetical protein